MLDGAQIRSYKLGMTKTTNHSDDLMTIARAARVTRRDFAARCYVRIAQYATTCAIVK